MKGLISLDNVENPFNFWNIMKHIILIVPHFSYSSCIAGFIQVAWENNRCKICKSLDMVEACRG